jgi:SagB-type dehydrogenase family enzyme
MILLALQPGAVLEPSGVDSVQARHPTRGQITMRGLDQSVRTTLLALASGPVVLTDRLDHEVDRLARWGLIGFSCVVGDREVMRATLTSDLARYGFEVDVAGGWFRLSRFVVSRRADDGLVVESPVAFTRVAIRHPGVLAALAALSTPASAADVGRALPDLPADGGPELVRFLAGVGVVGLVEEGQLAEDTDPELCQRELPDLLLHWASRIGLSDRVVGSLYPFRERIPPSPITKPLPAGPLIALPQPDPETLARKDPPLADVMERRRSVRRFGQRPITIDELGEFLFRVARVRQQFPQGPSDDPPYGTSDRTYPSAGAAYDLELYLTALRCNGIRAGIYHYEPVEHALTLVTDDPKWTVALLDDANKAVGSTPQLLLTLTSRFSRLTWKYRGLSYAATLKNVGVLSAHMYLVATAMGLAPCAVGTGDSALFAKATGIDWRVESSVGEFALGTLPEQD